MNEKKITSSQEILKANARSRWTPRLLGGAVGLILLTAGFLKATDMDLFIQQIRNYGIIYHYALLVTSAWGLIILECALGAALLVLYRPGLTLPTTVLLLSAFLGAALWAWFNGRTEECGCFGAWVRRTPAEAVIEDIMLLAATCLVWIGYRRTHVPQPRAKAWAVGTACLIGLVLPVAFGFPTSRIDLHQSQGVDLEIGYIHIRGLDNIDLNYGVYLIILMDTGCLHCHEIVPELNMLAKATDLPSVIALSTNEELQRIKFVEEFQPIFPIGQIKEEIFSRLLNDRDIPCIILISDGHVQHVWDQTIPDKDRIKAVSPLYKKGQG